MAEFCYVVSITEWDDDLDGKHEYWEDSRVCRVFREYKDAAKYIEENANSMIPECIFHWFGDRRYGGSITDYDDMMRYGLLYKIDFVALD